MKHLVTEISIDAPAAVVWDTLTDLPAYAEWNPFIVEAAGDVEVGARLRNRLEPPEGKGMTFQPTVTVVEPNRKFEWLGRLVLPGVFDGRHIFELEETTEGTRFVQREEFTGILVPLFARSLDKGTKAGFEAMNQAIKQRAEAAANNGG
ncbi:MAG: SRPBCC domain-containing protein [Acidimicrobiia bacterium]|nr:SRPBCC domain-containing protein [Acidimicrobiia bacterium]